MDYSKISGPLLSVYEDGQEAGPASLVVHSRSLEAALPLDVPVSPQAVVFLHCDENADLGNLVSKGLVLNNRRGRIRTALMPLDLLDDLSETPEVQRVIASQKMKPRLDRALAKVEIPAFRTCKGLSGKNVIVGVVDTGIDPKHPDFAGRILRIWDQTKHGPGVPEGRYGVELMGNDLTKSHDEDGHGTHVAGIAAGAGAKYTGVAPEAELVIVKTTFQDAHIADGIRYIFRIAEELTRPAVVNLSLGGHYDPHDGSDSLSLLIDDEIGPGKIVVCAAGNEGTDDIHARIKLGAPATETLKFRVSAKGVEYAALNGWYPGSGKLEISVTSPERLSTPFQPVISTGNFRTSQKLGSYRVIVQTPPRDPQNKDHYFLVEIQGIPKGTPLARGTWELRVRNSEEITGHLDLWTLDDQSSPTVIFRDDEVENSYKIGSPGCSRQAVTVAAYVTRNEWTDRRGNAQSVEMELHKLADFSSAGPLRDETQKPDVTAPGAMIVSALSSDSTQEGWTIVDNLHFAEAGTSMASPFICGTIALLLEQDPQLAPENVKAKLKSASRIPRRSAETFDARWGFGLLDGSRL